MTLFIIHIFIIIAGFITICITYYDLKNNVICTIEKHMSEISSSLDNKLDGIERRLSDIEAKLEHKLNEDSNEEDEL